jgi:hypothetical protein
VSKRFGRNQKRAMRAEIALNYQALVLATRKAGDLADDNYELNRQIRNARAHAYQLETAIADTRDVLGEFFVTLPPVTKPLREGVDVLNLAHSQPRDRYDRMLYGACAEVMDMVQRFESLEAIRTDIQEQFGDVRGMMHIRFKTAAGLMSYAFSPNSFKGMNRDRAASIIADGLRRYMLENRVFFDRLGVK